MRDKSIKNDGYGTKGVGMGCSRKPTQDCYLRSWRTSKKQLTNNSESTMVVAKRMIGRDWSDKAVQNDIKFCAFKTIEKSSNPHNARGH